MKYTPSPFILLKVIVVIIAVIVAYFYTISSGRRNAEAFNSYGSYQKLIQCEPDQPMTFPKNVKEIQEIVLKAVKNKSTVKAVGAKHSITSIICTSGTPISLSNFKQFHLHSNGDVSLGSGLTLREALTLLEERNRTLVHIPMFSGITIGGAIGTGAHGSSLLHPTSLSDQVVSLNLINGRGEDVQVPSNSSDSSSLPFFKLNLGLLGIIYQVRLSTVPIFKMRLSHTLYPDTLLEEDSGNALLKMAKSSDYFQTWWFPSTSSIVAAEGRYYYREEGEAGKFEIEGNARSNLISNIAPLTAILTSWVLELFQKFRYYGGLQTFEATTMSFLLGQVANPRKVFTSDENTQDNSVSESNSSITAIGTGWHLLASECSPGSCWFDNDWGQIPFFEYSIAFPFSKLGQVVEIVKDVMKQSSDSGRPLIFPMSGILLRYHSPSGAELSIAGGREAVIMDWVVPMRRNWWAEGSVGMEGYQVLVQRILGNEVIRGRPHWGKNGMGHFKGELISEQFLAKMKEMDPQGVFSNGFLQSLQKGKQSLRHLNLNPLMGQRCAMFDACICDKDEDCGKHQRCISHDKFNVCSDK